MQEAVFLFPFSLFSNFCLYRQLPNNPCNTPIHQTNLSLKFICTMYSALKGHFPVQTVINKWHSHCTIKLVAEEKVWSGTQKYNARQPKFRRRNATPPGTQWGICLGRATSFWAVLPQAWSSPPCVQETEDQLLFAYLSHPTASPPGSVSEPLSWLDICMGPRRLL
jgi:hypothetical protein